MKIKASAENLELRTPIAIEEKTPYLRPIYHFGQLGI